MNDLMSAEVCHQMSYVKFFVFWKWSIKKIFYGLLYQFKNCAGNFPGGAVVKNPPANAGNMGLIPGPGRSHMPGSN